MNAEALLNFIAQLSATLSFQTGMGQNVSTPAFPLTCGQTLPRELMTRERMPVFNLRQFGVDMLGQVKFVTSTPSAVIAEGRELAARMDLEEIAEVMNSSRSGAIAVAHGFRHVQFPCCSRVPS